jgi:serine/threonine-protein kinase
MLAGNRPFDRGNAQDTIKAILHEPVEPPSCAQPDLPRELDAIVSKATSKSRAERYQHVDDFVADIRAARRRLTPEQDRIPLRPFCDETATTRTGTLLAAAHGLPGAQ